jgi:hypothetical protein
VGWVVLQVQGMSFIAAILLLNMDVADAFVCFANLLNRPCHVTFFRMDEDMVSLFGFGSFFFYHDTTITNIVMVLLFALCLEAPIFYKLFYFSHLALCMRRAGAGGI